MSVGAGIVDPNSSHARRHSDRHRNKQTRRDRARKATALSGEGSASEALVLEYRSAARIDALEGVATADAGGGDDDDDFYDDEDGGGGGSSAASKARSKSRRGGGGRKRSGGGGGDGQGSLPKRLKARSLASVLVEDAGRFAGVGASLKHVQAEARTERSLPPRKFCPVSATFDDNRASSDRASSLTVRSFARTTKVTGLFGIYTDPKSGIPYANLRALEQIREREPPWWNSSGAAAYHESVKSLRGDDE